MLSTTSFLFGKAVRNSAFFVKQNSHLPNSEGGDKFCHFSAVSRTRGFG